MANDSKDFLILVTKLDELERRIEQLELELERKNVGKIAIPNKKYKSQYHRVMEERKDGE